MISPARLCALFTASVMMTALPYADSRAASAGTSCAGTVTDGPSRMLPLKSRPDTIRIKIDFPELIDDDAMKGGPELLTIATVGDIMTGTTYPTVRLPENGGKDLFRDVKEILCGADVAAGNLEGAICEGGTCTKRLASGRSYAFRMPPDHAELLSDAGLDFLSLANNHSNDFGSYGSTSSMQLLDKEGIGYAGLPGHETAVKEIGGVRYGFCAFGHNSHTIKHQDTSAVRRIVSSLADSCDIVIVSFHGGAEGADKAHLPYGTETYLGEDRGDLRSFARLCIDCGADVVFGHGPHVTRAVEVYRGRFVAYSLGNFCTPFGINLNGINGHAPVVEIAIAKDGRFVRGKIYSFIQQYGIGPRKDSLNIVARHIRSLSEEDVPDSPLVISDDGDMDIVL